MDVKSISGGAVAFKPQSLNDAGINHSAKVTLSTPVSSENQTTQVGGLTSGANSKVSTANKPSPVTLNESNEKPVRAMSHVVESYNSQGKVRIKFLDSNNNVIYQIPSEMVAKTQDLMTNSQAATNIKG